MRPRNAERSTTRVVVHNSTVVIAGAAYMAVLGWAMIAQSYDIWGGIVAMPIAAIVAVALARRILATRPDLVRIATIGFAAKLAGAAARYWVAFGAYGGSDAGRYHSAGRIIADDIRSGRLGPWGLFPQGEGTEFVERVTGTLYALVGASKLGGFVWFAVLGYLGVLFSIRAAVIAAPRLDLTRYTWFCMFAPSLVFWPSSIGKEAWMTLSLGVLTYGIARVLVGGRFTSSAAITALGAAMAATVRPHISAIWLAAAGLAALWSAVRSFERHERGRYIALAATVLVAIATITVGQQALDYLATGAADDSVSEQLDAAFRRTLLQTAQGGSEFVPPSMAGPVDYPFAILRTLTRPLLGEADTFTDLLPAVETTLIGVIALVGIRRLRSLRAMLRDTPLTLFHLSATVLAALGYSGFSNLGILVRQRSLILPSLLFLLCLPKPETISTAPIAKTLVRR